MKQKFILFRNWQKRYKLSLQDANYDEVFCMRISRMHLFVVTCLSTVVLIALTTILIAFTNLREFIPGYPDRELRREITLNALRVDSLSMELERRDRFFESIKRIVSGEDPEEMTLEADTLPLPVVAYDSLDTGYSESEAGFREMIEERERFNLALDAPVAPFGEFYHFFPPVAGGVVTNAYDERTRHFAVDLVVKPDAQVSAVLDGVVILSDWTLKTGYVIQVQHSGGWVSVYKHNSKLLKRQGDRVKAGEVIAVVGNTGEETTGPHLHFELWNAGNPVNPANFINFN